MCTAPSLASDRLAGFANTSGSFLDLMEQQGVRPKRWKETKVDEHLGRVCEVIQGMLDGYLFPWVAEGREPTPGERDRAVAVIADRLTTAEANPIIRNAQEERQIEAIKDYLFAKGYVLQKPKSGYEPQKMAPGTFCIRFDVMVKQTEEAEENGGDGEVLVDDQVQNEDSVDDEVPVDELAQIEEDVQQEVNTPAPPGEWVKMPIDVVIQPKTPRASRLPIFIECKSAGDFVNPNKRRKEESDKIRLLKSTYGEEVELYLFLCGYFNEKYLAFEAREGLDWIWEHRMSDMDLLGL